MTLELFLGLWGAVVATAVAIHEVFSATRDKPRIAVTVKPVSSTAGEGQDTHGVLHQVKHGDDLLWEEADVEITISNAGSRPLQITDVFIETDTHVSQVRPTGLPAVLEQNTALAVRVQPELFAPSSLVRDGESERLRDTPVLAIGVLDALGKRHPIPRHSADEIVASCRRLPLRSGVFRHKETGNLVFAVQVKDATTLVKKVDRVVA